MAVAGNKPGGAAGHIHHHQRCRHLSMAGRMILRRLAGRMILRRLAGGLLLALPIGLSAVAQDRIIGVASVIDGDTIEIHGQRIRLFGIDVPESGQLCMRPMGERWRCGQQASFALADHIGRATVRCEPREMDRYGRVVAVRFVNNGSEPLDGSERLGCGVSTVFSGLRPYREGCARGTDRHLVRRL